MSKVCLLMIRHFHILQSQNIRDNYMHASANNLLYPLIPSYKEYCNVQLDKNRKQLLPLRSIYSGARNETNVCSSAWLQLNTEIGLQTI